MLAELALVLFAVVPPQWKLLAIFFNGLPLGMVWGMVVWYLEGRRASEFLLAGLSCSFIVSSATVKDVGLFVMDSWGVSESAMPVVTGLLFLGPFLLFVWMLDQIPEPNAADIAERCHREPMDGRRRFAFFGHFLTGMLLLLVAYFFVTAYRDYRDNYGIEIVVGLGLRDVPGGTGAT